MRRIFKSKSRTFHWSFDCPVERIWTVLADTERFNEAAGLPKYEVSERINATGSVEFFGKTNIGPVQISWQEMPTNWVKNSWFVHERDFSQGPLATLIATLKLFPDGERCRATYKVEAAPRNMLGWLMLATTFFSSTKKKFDQMAQQANQFALGQRETEFAYQPPTLTPGAEMLANTAVKSLSKSPNAHNLEEELVRYLKTRPEMDVRRIRPLTLARKWNVAPDKVIELCLQSVRDRLLAVRWDLLCPRCRGAKARTGSLDRLPKGAHCPSCNIDYDRDYAKNVEVSFRPVPALRDTDDREFCLFSPMTTPHIWAQLYVAAGDTQSIATPHWPHNSLRLRTLDAGPECRIDASLTGNFDVTFDGETLSASHAASSNEITFRNCSDLPCTFVVEDAAWTVEALTADRVFSMQVFRDLFDDSILRPGDHVDIEHATIMFVDFKGSSALFESVGDVRAYKEIREFFAKVAGLVRTSHGAVVKTVGDGIHVAFHDPADALKCALAIREVFHCEPRKAGPPQVYCKIGLHAGKTIAVTLNHRLDYYGTAVNLASRLCDLSDGNDIVCSATFMQDARIAEFLPALNEAFHQVQVKGFDDRIEVMRIPRTDLEKPSTSQRLLKNFPPPHIHSTCSASSKH